MALLLLLSPTMVSLHLTTIESLLNNCFLHCHYLIPSPTTSSTLLSLSLSPTSLLLAIVLAAIDASWVRFSQWHSAARICPHRTMAPVIRIPAEDTFKTLQNVLKKRIDAKRILREREKKMLNAEEYEMMEVKYNNKPFLQPVDADDTKASIYYIRQKFTRYACKT